MKGTVAHTLTRHTFICLPGAKSLGGLDEIISCLKANGTVEILEAFNIDKLTDKKAGESAMNLRKKLSTFGLKVTSAIWGDMSLVSIADYFLYRIKAKRNHVHEVDITAAA